MGTDYTTNIYFEYEKLEYENSKHSDLTCSTPLLTPPHYHHLHPRCENTSSTVHHEPL